MSTSGEQCHGNGLLVLIVGASGTGKDTLLREVERTQSVAANIVVMQRTITRPPEPSETHRPVSADEFDALERAGAFSLSWRAHGFSYAVSRDVEAELARGMCCIASVSRTVVADARRRFPRTFVVEVTVPRSIREQRLRSRAREDADAIRQRLSHQPEMPDNSAPDLLLDNSGPIETARDTLLRALAQAHPACRPDIAPSFAEPMSPA